MTMMTPPPLDHLDQEDELVEGPQPVEGPQSMETQAETASTVENQQVDEPQTSRFTWTIESFSRLNIKKLHSEIFAVGGYKWRVLIFPKGNNVEHMSMYLDVADSPTLPYGWSRYAQFSLSVVNQIHGKFTIREDTQHQFNARESDWGFTSFMSLSDLYDPSKGFLVNDTCVIEADVAVSRVIDYWSYDSKKETGYVGLKTEKTSLEMPIHLSEGEDNEEGKILREVSKTAMSARRKSRAQKGKFDGPRFDAPLSSSGTDSSHQPETVGTTPPPSMTPEKPGADKSSPNVVATSESDISKSQADIYTPLATIPASTRPFSAPLVSEIPPSIAAPTLSTSTTPTSTTSSSTSLVKDLLLRGQNLRAAILKKPTATQPATALTPAPPLSEDQVQARQFLSCLRTSTFRAAISQQKAIEEAVSLLSSDFVGSTSSSSSSTFIEQFRNIANTLVQSTNKIAEADQFFKRKEEVTQQMTDLADCADAMVKDSSSISDAIKKKQAELKALQEDYAALQTELEKITPQLDPLLDELSTIDVQELNWVSTQQAATKAISQIDEQWNQALALLAPFFT